MKKHISKLLLIILLVATLFTTLLAIPASAATSTVTLYFDANDWDVDGAIFRAWTWGGTQADSWVNLTDTDGDGVYEGQMPSDRTNVIFLRASSGSSGWNGEWNRCQTTISSSNNMFTINGWSYGSLSHVHDFNSDGTCKGCTTTTTFKTIYVDVDQNIGWGSSIYFHNWNSSSGAHYSQWPGTKMSQNAEGVYTAVIPTYYNKIIFSNGSSAKQTVDLSLPTNDNNYFGISSTVSGGKYTGSWSEICYSVVGHSALCGSDWDEEDVTNEMILDAESGLYSKTFERVSKGTYELKIARGHQWIASWGDGAENFSLTTEQHGNITVTFNPSTKEIAYSFVHVHDVVDGVCVDCGEEYDAYIGFTFYDTVQAALDAANEGETVVVLNSIASELFIDEKNIILDLNGYVLGSTLTNNGDVTLAGGVINNVIGEGSVTVSDDAAIAREHYSFKGAGIRYADVNGIIASPSAVSLRFGYVLSDEVISWGWDYEIGDNFSASKEGLNISKTGISSLVFANTPTSWLKTEFRVQLWFTIEVGDTVYTIYDVWQSRVPENVLNAVAINEVGAVADYAKNALYLLDSVEYAEYAPPVSTQDEEE